MSQYSYEPIAATTAYTSNTVAATTNTAQTGASDMLFDPDSFEMDTPVRDPNRMSYVMSAKGLAPTPPDSMPASSVSGGGEHLGFRTTWVPFAANNQPESFDYHSHQPGSGAMGNNIPWCPF